MTDFEKGIAMFKAGERLPELITPEMQDLYEGYNIAWLEVQSPYTQGYAAFEDGAPCPSEPEAKRGWWDAREMDRFRAWEMSNRPLDTDSDFSWWAYLAARGDVIDARQHGRW